MVDAAAFSVKSAEGALLPQVSASAGVSSSYRNTLPGVSSSADGTTSSASIGATLTIPIYQAGRASAQVRQSKESLGQARIEVDVSRDQVRAAVVSAWSQYVAARESVSANIEGVSAAQLALNGVIEERNVGQRTTLDVLNSQADVITAQINVANAERDCRRRKLRHPVGSRPAFGRKTWSSGHDPQAAGALRRGQGLVVRLENA